MPKLPTDYKTTLLEHILPEGFIKDGFITTKNNPSNYSYEDYLIEFLNLSNYFMHKTQGAVFTKPVDESKGQCDAITPHYSIDFKLIIGQSIQYAKNLTSTQINTDGRGVTNYRIAKGNGEYKAVWLHKALRGKTSEELEQIFSGGSHDEFKDDIFAFLKSINKKKNLLLLYPVIFEYKGEESCSTDGICEALYDDFSASLEWRNERHSGYDTFIAFFYEKALQIAVYDEKTLVPVDSIPFSKSDTFNWIRDFYWDDPLVSSLKPIISD